MSATIDIVTFDSRGLRRSAGLVRGALAPAFDAQVHVLKLGKGHLAYRAVLKLLANRLFGEPRLMIFLEVVPSAWLGLAGDAVLVPNQEWVVEDTEKNLPRCTQIWCKTRSAESIFAALGYATRYIGFSSKDMYLPDSRMDYGRFLHVAGRSRQKGTSAVLELWRRHPEWPTLTVVSDDPAISQLAAANITVRSEEVPEAELQTLMNVSGIHLCPSEAEGFGHTLSEGLSAKALVITTDAAPMNEVVRPEYGLLAPWRRTERMGFGERCFVDPDDLERRVVEVLGMPEAEKARRGELARQVWLERSASFAPRLRAAVQELIAAQPRKAGVRTVEGPA